MKKLHNKLLSIVNTKQNDLLRIKRSDDVFRSALDAEKKVAILAEIKLASPTAVRLGSKREILNRAITYEKAGVSAISVITEPHYFKGDVHFIPRIKRVTHLPVLQKDFIIDPFQVYEAKMIGSDALLFIARIVRTSQLRKLVSLAQTLGVEPVVEINDEEDLKKALRTTTKIIAVNARDLRTFVVNVDRACEVMRKIPDRYIKLGFSGVHSSVEIKKYKKGWSPSAF